MMAYAWKSLAWFLVGVAVALGFLLVPLQVAAERKKLDRTIDAIANARRDIRSLETEFDTRANLAQLEQWNGDTLRLVAPSAAQFVPSETALAEISFRPGAAPGVMPGEAAVRTAALVVPALPSADAAAPLATPAPATPAPATSAPAAPVALAAAAPQPSVAHAVAEVRTAMAARGKSQAVAMLDRQLLSDTTIGDLLSGAHAETSRAR